MGETTKVEYIVQEQLDGGWLRWGPTYESPDEASAAIARVVVYRGPLPTRIVRETVTTTREVVA